MVVYIVVGSLLFPTFTLAKLEDKERRKLGYNRKVVHVSQNLSENVISGFS